MFRKSELQDSVTQTSFGKKNMDFISYYIYVKYYSNLATNKKLARLNNQYCTRKYFTERCYAANVQFCQRSGVNTAA